MITRLLAGVLVLGFGQIVGAQPTKKPASPPSPATNTPQPAANPAPTTTNAPADPATADVPLSPVEKASLERAVQDLTSRLAELERKNQDAAPSPSAAQAQQQSEALQAEVQSLRGQVESLRTQLAGQSAPSVSTSGGAVTHDKGFAWQTDDGRYRLRVGAYFQPRLEATLVKGGQDIDALGFRLRRSRLFLNGHIRKPELRYNILLDLLAKDAPTLDAYAEYEIWPELAIRVGQGKVPYLRQWISSSTKLNFLDRSAAIEAFRYDRDQGIWLTGRLMNRVNYQAGISNGSAVNERNDNIDFAAAARFDANILGKSFDGYGDIAHSAKPSVMVGAGVVHDLVALPSRLAGADVDSQDVDDNKVNDNVRVISASADIAARWHGFEIAGEWFIRQQRWGSILQHSSNSAVSQVISSDSDGVRTDWGFFTQASYFVCPGLLEVGARVGYSDLPALGVANRHTVESPLGESAWEWNGMVQLYQEGIRTLGLHYSYVNYLSDSDLIEAAASEHRVIAEMQFYL